MEDCEKLSGLKKALCKAKKRIEDERKNKKPEGDIFSKVKELLKRKEKK